MMKHLSVALLLSIVVCLVSASLVEDEFLAFQKKFNKQYASEAEYQARLGTFEANMMLIKQKNIDAQQRMSDTRFGITQFADISPAEFRQKYLSSVPAVRDPSWPVAPDYDDEVTANLPPSFDWRPKGAVTPVKNQGDCGSCWSFSTTGNIEGQWFLAGNPLTSLSEQNLVDCDTECMTYMNQSVCDAGCDGGLQPNAYHYVMSAGGIDTESSYPYLAVDGKCHFKPANIGAKINNFTMVSSNETQMAAYLVQHGPLAIAADAAEWQFYMGGVFDLPCGKSLDHGILIVGYGNETTIFGHHVDYWIVKNSWGATWGEQGYLKVERGTGECGLNDFVSSSIITHDK